VAHRGSRLYQRGEKGERSRKASDGDLISLCSQKKKEHRKRSCWHCSENSYNRRRCGKPYLGPVGKKERNRKIPIHAQPHGGIPPRQARKKTEYSANNPGEDWGKAFVCRKKAQALTSLGKGAGNSIATELLPSARKAAFNPSSKKRGKGRETATLQQDAEKQSGVRSAIDPGQKGRCHLLQRGKKRWWIGEIVATTGGEE